MLKSQNQNKTMIYIIYKMCKNYENNVIIGINKDNNTILVTLQTQVFKLTLTDPQDNPSSNIFNIGS